MRVGSLVLDWEAAVSVIVVGGTAVEFEVLRVHSILFTQLELGFIKEAFIHLLAGCFLMWIFILRFANL